MDTLKSITPTVAIAGQPTEADLQGLKDRGYAGVANLRNEGEPDQPLGPAAEAEVARRLGLDYVHYGVSNQPLSREGVAAVCDFLDRHEGEPVLVHCRSAGRAAALVLLHQAKKRGWKANEAIANGRAMGLDVKGGLQMLVEQYLNANPRAEL